MTLRLLVVDDEPDVAALVAFGAQMIWPDCEVTTAGSGEEALSSFAEKAADLVVLDVAMPPPNGFEVCRRLREVSAVPILMLTVRDATEDKVRALDLGADDYLTKPFDPLELQARLRALVRRAAGAPSEDRPDFAAEDLTVDFDTHEVRLAGEPIRLTTTEYRLLEELIRHAGTTLPRELLLERVWGSEWTDPGYLKVFVRRLRRKLGDDPDRPRYIETVHGIGYRFIPRR